MARKRSNPYESPNCHGSRRSDGQTNSFVRGFGFAVPLGVLGFLIPMAIGLIVQLVQKIDSLHAGSPASDWTSLFYEFLDASIGCGILFALSAILNYSPRIRLGLVRSLLFVGLSAFVGVILSAAATFLFGLEQQTYTSDPWRWLRVLIAAAIPAAYTFAQTYRRFTLHPDDSAKAR